MSFRHLVVGMEVSDDYFMNNCNWDPVYLQELFREEFLMTQVNIGRVQFPMLI